jgi:hypothetical protein
MHKFHFNTIFDLFQDVYFEYQRIQLTFDTTYDKILSEIRVSFPIIVSLRLEGASLGMGQCLQLQGGPVSPVGSDTGAALDKGS